MSTIRTGELDIEVLEAGTGQPVLLIHGSNSDRRTWAAQADALAAGFRVMLYSRRYHWPNPPPGETADYSMEEQLNDLAAVLRGVALEPVHLVGHSYGAYLALVHGLRHPATVASLVLAEPPVIPLLTGYPPEPVEILRLLFRRPRIALAIIRFVATGLGPATAAAEKDDMDKALARLGAAVLGKGTFTAMSDERLEISRRNFFKAELLSPNAMLPLQESEVRALTVPVLLLAGEKSPAVFHRLLDLLLELLPNAGLQIVAGASHNLHEGNPAAFNDAVVDFLGGQVRAHRPDCPCY